MEIIDCVAKEKMLIQRYGGDILLEFFDKKGRKIYTFGMEMKRNSPDIYKKIEERIDEIKGFLKERPEVYYNEESI